MPRETKPREQARKPSPAKGRQAPAPTRAITSLDALRHDFAKAARLANRDIAAGMVRNGMLCLRAALLAEGDAENARRATRLIREFDFMSRRIAKASASRGF